MRQVRALTEEGEAATLIKDKRLCLTPFFCAPQQLFDHFFSPPPPLIYCSGKHIPSLSSQRLQHGRDPCSLFSGRSHTRTHTHTTTHARASPLHDTRVNMSNHVSVRDDAQKKNKQITKHCTVKFPGPRRGWGRGALEGIAGGVGLEDDTIRPVIRANVAEIKGKVVGRRGQNAGDKAR